MAKAKVIIESKEDLIEKYDQLCKNHLKKQSSLKHLTDSELLIWIAGQTYAYGRDWESSVENAEFHLMNRKKAEKLFSTKDIDTLGAC